jgi:hypothetical protein
MVSEIRIMMEKIIVNLEKFTRVIKTLPTEISLWKKNLVNLLVHDVSVTVSQAVVKFRCLCS